MMATEAPARTPTVKVGDRVTYRVFSLQDYRGKVVEIGRTPHGGDCWVTWERPWHMARTEQCSSQLMVLDQEV